MKLFSHNQWRSAYELVTLLLCHEIKERHISLFKSCEHNTKLSNQRQAKPNQPNNQLPQNVPSITCWGCKLVPLLLPPQNCCAIIPKPISCRFFFSFIWFHALQLHTHTHKRNCLYNIYVNFKRIFSSRINPIKQYSKHDFTYWLLAVREWKNGLYEIHQPFVGSILFPHSQNSTCFVSLTRSAPMFV